MNPTTILHFVHTECRRSLLAAVPFWLLLAFKPEPDWLFFLGIALAVWIAAGDHWTRPTAQWRARPASVADWAASRIALGLLFFSLPVAIQQGWVYHSTGFGAGTVALATTEGAIVAFVLFAVPFSVASLAEGWNETVGLTVLAATAMWMIGAFVSVDFTESTRPSDWALHWTATLATCLAVVCAARRKESRSARAMLVLFLSAVFALTHHRTGRTVRERPADLPTARLDFSRTVEFAEGPEFQMLSTDLVVRNLGEGEFFQMETMSRNGRELTDWKEKLENIGYLTGLQKFYGWHAVSNLLPTNRTVLTFGKIMTNREETLGLFPPLLDDSETSTTTVGGTLYRCEPLIELPLREGEERLLDGVYFRLEKDPLLRIQRQEINIRIEENDLWALLWPDDDSFGRWLEGATVKVFEDIPVGEVREAKVRY